MTIEERDIQRKLKVLQHAGKIGNVRKACRYFGFGTQTDQDWVFVTNDAPHICRVYGNRIADGGDVIRRWCLEGYGLALKSEWDVRGDLEAGTLVCVLDAYAPQPSALQMVYPAGAVQPRRVRVLMDHLSQTLS